MSRAVKTVHSRVEIAIADLSFERARLTNAARDAAAAIEALGTEMTLFAATSGLVEDDEGHIVPELLTGSDAAQTAAAQLEMIVQHGRTF